MKRIIVLSIFIPIFLTAGEKSWIPHYLESKNALKKKYNEPSIVIKTYDNKTTKVPTSLVQQMQTLKNMQEDIGAQAEISVNQVSSTQLRPVLALMESAQDHPQLKDVKLYDAMGKDVHITDAIEVLKAVNYLDIKPPIDKPVIGFLTKQIADDQDSPWWKPRKNTPLSAQLTGFDKNAKEYYGALIARHYFLKTGKNLPNLSQDLLNNENYAFSIRDYLEYPILRQRLFPIGHANFVVFQLQVPPNPDYHVWRLSRLDIGDLDGFKELKEQLPQDLAQINVDRITLANNKIKNVNPSIFNDFNALREVDLSNNPLTPETRKQLAAAAGNIRFIL